MLDHEVERCANAWPSWKTANDGLVQKIEHFQESDAGLRLGEQRYRSLVEVITEIVWNTLPQASLVEQPRWSEFISQTFAELRLGLAERGAPR